MFSFTSQRSRLAVSEACKRASRWSLTWSKVPKAGRLRMSRVLLSALLRENLEHYEKESVLIHCSRHRWEGKGCDPNFGDGCRCLTPPTLLERAVTNNHAGRVETAARWHRDTRNNIG